MRRTLFPSMHLILATACIETTCPLLKSSLQRWAEDCALPIRSVSSKFKGSEGKRSHRVIVLLHGDAPFGWQGFAFAILMTLALVIILEELVRGVLPKRPRKQIRRVKHAKKPH